MEIKVVLDDKDIINYFKNLSILEKVDIIDIILTNTGYEVVESLELEDLRIMTNVL